jgi:KDO2-lipid IV(A) lauroyltransferase
MTSVVEEWVREYPKQWLWMHRRWRVPAAVQGNVSFP